MNWISNVVRPKIRSFLNRRDTPENLWIKCPETGQLVFYKDVEANSFVIPGSDYHMRMGATARMKSMFDQFSEDFAIMTEGRLTNHPLEYFRRFYGDMGAFSPGAVNVARDFLGANHLLFGTDYSPEPIESTVNELPGLKLPRAFELALLRGNAERLFPKFKAKT